MEKLDYLLWGPVNRAALLEALSGLDVVALTLQLAADVPDPPLLLGRGPELGALVQVWLRSYQSRPAVEAALPGEFDGYLVTESEVQPLVDRDWPDGEPSPGISHVSWFPKPSRLTEEEFLHGWHEVHSPHSAALHPLRLTYLRDTVVRTLTPGSPPVRAVVVERFRDDRDYLDPSRLFGAPDAFEQNLRDLPGYADLDDLSCRPMHEVVLRSGHARAAQECHPIGGAWEADNTGSKGAVT
ncbi:MAG TPA: hypothetical protein VNU26_05005 [Mycobacteriales bacterium]|nr:hypothetical protein [Mycobacteriales bacterium]